MKICLLEPFMAGSHAAWAHEFARFSRHQVNILSLDGRHWKWRMHGGAVQLAEQFQAQQLAPDLLLASDMLDLTTFLALTRAQTAALPTAVYFHENQLTYPWSPRDADPGHQRDAHYGFINYTSALAADAVLFNSDYHRHAFLDALPAFLNSFPDYRGLDSIAAITAKSRTLPLGLDLQRLDRAKPPTGSAQESLPLILWNHRWEYDKQPEAFFQALFQLNQEGYAFEVAVLGEAYRDRPAIFAEAQQRLGAKLVHSGFVKDFDQYAAWLWRADILPVTAIHDFFGASVVQAIYCNTIPLLPNRLAYPEHLPTTAHAACLYHEACELPDRLRTLLQEKAWLQPLPDLRATVAGYDWQQLTPQYDDLLEALVARQT